MAYLKIEYRPYLSLQIIHQDDYILNKIFVLVIF